MLPNVIICALIDEGLHLVVEVDCIIKVSLAQGRARFAHGKEFYRVVDIRQTTFL